MPREIVENIDRQFERTDADLPFLQECFYDQDIDITDIRISNELYEIGVYFILKIKGKEYQTCTKKAQNILNQMRSELLSGEGKIFLRVHFSYKQGRRFLFTNIRKVF